MRRRVYEVDWIRVLKMALLSISRETDAGLTIKKKFLLVSSYKAESEEIAVIQQQRCQLVQIFLCAAKRFFAKKGLPVAMAARRPSLWQ